MAEPFEEFSEEFSFKPLTEGLGFHKKAEKMKADITSTNARPATPQRPAPAARESAPPRSSIFAETESRMMSPRAPETSRAASQSISELMATLPPSLDFLDDKQDLTRSMNATPIAPLAATSSASSRPQIFQPLAPREEYKSAIATGPTVGSVLPAPGTKAGGTYAMNASAAAPSAATAFGGAMYRDRMSEGFAKAFPIDTPRTETSKLAIEEGLTPVATNFSAGLIDAMVVAGISTILLVCIITITHINLVAMLTNAQTDGATQLNLVFLFFAVLQMYMLVSRAFFGSSLGEWAFDLQLGTAAQQRQLYYPLMVLWRMLVVTVTGVLTLPLLSFAFGRDLSRYVSGLQLYRRN